MNLQEALALVAQDEPDGVPWEKQPEELDIPLPDPFHHIARLRWEKSPDDGRGRMQFPDIRTLTNSEKQEVASRMAKFRVRRANAQAKTGTELSEDTFALPATSPSAEYGRSLAEKIRGVFR